MTKQAKQYFTIFLVFASITYGLAFVLYNGLIASALLSNICFLIAALSWICAISMAAIFLHEILWNGGK